MSLVTPPNTVPHTIFAFRLAGESEWKVRSGLLTRAETSALVSKEYPGHKYECKLIHETRIDPRLCDEGLHERLATRGWAYHQEDQSWRGPEAMRYKPNPIQKPPLSMETTLIAGFSTFFTMNTGRENIYFFSEINLHDTLPSFVALTNRVENKEEAGVEAALSNEGRFKFWVFNTKDANTVRVVAESVNAREDWYEFHWCDVRCQRDALCRCFSEFFRDLSEHPGFIHDYLISHDGQEYEVECDGAESLAESLWDEAVAEGRIDLENCDEDIQYHEWKQRIVQEHVQIPEQEKEFIEEYITMLKTLEVPDGWI